MPTQVTLFTCPLQRRQVRVYQLFEAVAEIGTDIIENLILGEHCTQSTRCPTADCCPLEE